MKLAFLRILRAVVYITDPNIEESISSICLSRDGLQVYHKIPTHLILRETTQRKLALGKYDELSTIFHNLSADVNRQKAMF